jgi:hypothetical protein
MQELTYIVHINIDLQQGCFPKLSLSVTFYTCLVLTILNILFWHTLELLASSLADGA